MVQRMQKALRHRGPDGTGEFLDTHVALAMCRLSIIDLLGGWQPLYNEDRSLILIVNGEIYNYVELRKELEARGHRFSTRSDCETILHLYEDYGSECVHHMRGMFALALWDVKAQRLLLARDRMGEKPLYYYQKGNQLIFASELKALLRSKIVPFDLDPASVDMYFHYQYVPEPGTPIKGVRKLDAAHLFVVDLNPWQTKDICYWRLADAPPIQGDPREILLDELENVSRLVVRSDVPVGVALSSGLDSSAIAALASKEYPGTLHAFCVGYANKSPDDERRGAKAFADYLGIPFHDVELNVQDMVRSFPDLVYSRDDPIADISGYGYHAVMRLARESGIPVMLQGQGGDELFWGYSWVTEAMRKTAKKLLTHENEWPYFWDYLGFNMPKYWGRRCLLEWAMDFFGLGHRLARFRYDRKAPAQQLIFYDWTPDFTEAISSMPSMYTPEFRHLLNGLRPESLFTLEQPKEPLDILFTRLICETYLKGNGITQGDRLSMASSVELRLPFLDHHLIELIVGLRKTRTDAELPPKAWLKAALETFVPPWVANRPKRGFTPPIRIWHEALFSAYSQSLISGYLESAGILKTSACRKLSKGGFTSNANVASPLSFKALVLELWCSQMKSLAAQN